MSAHNADTSEGRDALQRGYNGICGAFAEMVKAIGIIGPSGDLTAVLDDLEDARRRLAPIAFPTCTHGSIYCPDCDGGSDD